ncbi:hypothetical protein [Priestia megaterium]|uniref:hypothetical protein n=1 Tax=Priestia megaterium TaxID=1404 RepID=UPI000BFB34AA|nr:hypothetical protein [Priestia megaterium]PGQ88265.1 hypothetical protein COA18_04880 [Priestia megaterium]
MKVKGLIKLLFVSVFLFSSLVFAPGLNASAKTAPPKIEVKSATRVYYDKLKVTKTTMKLYYQIKTANNKKYYKYLRVEGKVDILDKRATVPKVQIDLFHWQGEKVKKTIKAYNYKPTTKFTIYAPSSWKELPDTKYNENLFAYIVSIHHKAPATGATWVTIGTDVVSF